MQYMLRCEVGVSFPFEASHFVPLNGVLAKHANVRYDRDQIDDIICEMIKRHPYVSGAKFVDVCVLWLDSTHNGNFSGYYHRLRFINENYENQPQDREAAIHFEK